MTTGCVAPPEIYTKLRVCERMHWTFAEYDATAADELLAAFEIWAMDARERD